MDHSNGHEAKAEILFWPKNTLLDVMLKKLAHLNSQACQINQPISGRVDRASATETVDSGSIPGRVIPKTIKTGIHSFPA